MTLRQEIEREIYELIDDMDPSGKNTERYKKHFASMSDAQFYKYMDNFFTNDKMSFQVGYEAMNNPVTIEFVNKVAKKQNIPLYEYIAKPYVNNDLENPSVTVYPVLTVDVPIKRLKQTVSSKSHTSITNLKRDARTNQVTGHDKTARITDVEAFSLIVQELYACAEELYGPMADDERAMYEMIKRIHRDGEVDLDDLPKDPTSRVTMNTINYFALSCALVNNLVDESGYVLPITAKAKEDKTYTIDRS